MDLFRRHIRVEVGGKLLQAPLTIAFDSEFDDTEEINTTTIKVYNLSPSTIAGIRTNSAVLLSAGYEGDVGAIFEGVVTKPVTTWSGVDKITEIECADQHGLYLKKKIVKTFAPGTPASVVLQYLIGQAGLGVGELSPVQDFIYRKGKTIKGNVSEAIKAVVKDTKSKMFITRGRIYIRDVGSGFATGFVVNKDTGLIDSPEPIEEETESENKKSDKKKVRKGWKIKMLLNHRISVDSVIRVQSRTANGTFRVTKGRHYTEGNSFYSEVECF